MKKFAYLFLCLLCFQLSFSTANAKVAPTVEPFASGTYGTFQFQDSYKGQFVAVGIGARAGLLLGPLFLGGEIHGQMPAFLKESGVGESQTDVDPLPVAKPWLSYGLAAGLKTRFISLMYTYIFDSVLEASIRTTSSGATTRDYKYHGKGEKYSALLHFTKNVSVGAEMARYRFNKYSLSSSTHSVPRGSKATRSPLDMTAYSILINYNIEVEVK